MRIPANVLTFAQDKIDVYKAFGDYFNHYRAMTLGAKVDYDNTISFEQKTEKIDKAMKEEIARVAQVQNFADFAPEVWATHPTYKWATFAVIGAMVDMVLPDTIIDNIGLFTEIRTGGFGDNFIFDIKPSDLFVVSKSSWGKRRSQIHKQFDGQVAITPEPRDITVGVSLYRVLAGKENLAEFAMKAVRSMETQVTLDAYDAFVTAMDAQPANGATKGLKVTGYSQDEAVRLAQTVTAFNGGQKAVFVGTQLAVSKVLPNGSNYRYDIESNYVKVGYVQTAFGYDVMVLPQVAKWDSKYDLALKDDRIHVLSPAGQKIVKLCIEGSTLTVMDDTYANANLAQNTTMKKSYGTGVAVNSAYGEIILS